VSATALRVGGAEGVHLSSASRAAACPFDVRVDARTGTRARRYAEPCDVTHGVRRQRLRFGMPAERADASVLPRASKARALPPHSIVARTARETFAVVRILMIRNLRGIALLALSVFSLCLHAASARVLFPNSLHLTRQIEDPVSRTTVAIDEYCFGNRMVSISGDRTVIADYDKQEVTEIDRRAGTYSVTRFDEIANAAAEDGGASRSARVQSDAQPDATPSWKLTPLGVRSSAAGRSVERFEVADEGPFKRKVEVDVDRSVGLSREAVEVLIGAAYPNPMRDEHEPILRAAETSAARGRVASNDATASSYGLPLTQSFTYSDSGTDLTFRTSITRIGSEAVPADALLIPPGAKRVESRATALRRQLRELDQLAPSSASPEN